jgi:hypothetical protein
MEWTAVLDNSLRGPLFLKVLFLLLRASLCRLFGKPDICFCSLTLVLVQSFTLALILILTIGLTSLLVLILMAILALALSLIFNLVLMFVLTCVRVRVLVLFLLVILILVLSPGERHYKTHVYTCLLDCCLCCSGSTLFLIIRDAG